MSKQEKIIYSALISTSAEPATKQMWTILGVLSNSFVFRDASSYNKHSRTRMNFLCLSKRRIASVLITDYLGSFVEDFFGDVLSNMKRCLIISKWDRICFAFLGLWQVQETHCANVLMLKLRTNKFFKSTNFNPKNSYSNSQIFSLTNLKTSLVIKQ